MVQEGEGVPAEKWELSLPRIFMQQETTKKHSVGSSPNYTVHQKKDRITHAHALTSCIPINRMIPLGPIWWIKNLPCNTIVLRRALSAHTMERHKQQSNASSRRKQPCLWWCIKVKYRRVEQKEAGRELASRNSIPSPDSQLHERPAKGTAKFHGSKLAEPTPRVVLTRALKKNTYQTHLNNDGKIPPPQAPPCNPFLLKRHWGATAKRSGQLVRSVLGYAAAPQIYAIARTMTWWSSRLRYCHADFLTRNGNSLDCKRCLRICDGPRVFARGEGVSVWLCEWGGGGASMRGCVRA